MRLKAIAEACLWLPGFAPDEDPIVTLGTVGEHKETGAIIPFPQISETKAQAAVKAIWPHLDASVLAGLSGDVTKFEANVAAIELLRKLESEDRQPNDDERAVLNRYTGWGGLPKAFNTQQADANWQVRAERLAELLKPAELKSAELSTPNAHYTSLEVIEAMWAMVERLASKAGGFWNLLPVWATSSGQCQSTLLERAW